MTSDFLKFDGDGSVLSGTMLGAMADDDVRIGEIGTATTPLRPAGKVDINGRLHDVVAEFGFVDAGQRVKVVNVTAFRIGVDAVRDA